MRGKNGRDYPCFYMLVEPNLVDTSCENALCLADSFGLSVSSRLLNALNVLDPIRTR